jgi:predicted dehydrogenase
LSDTAAGPWSWELTSGENAAYPRTQESCYFIAGTEGALAIPRLELWHHGEKGHWWSPIEREAVDEGMLLGGDDPLANQMRHFCNVARGMAGPLLDARGGTETLRATLAVLEAARTGRSVDLI